MKRQFEILDKLYKLTKQSEERIKRLKEEINNEHLRIRNELLKAYSHDNNILYLVQFDTYGITFYKATKTKLHEVKLTWYGSKIRINPTSYDEALHLLENLSNPTNCEISSYREFGYFHDIEKRWDRIDWITEEIMGRRYLFEIQEMQFKKAMDLVYFFYVGGQAGIS